MSTNEENMVGERPSLVKKFANKFDIDPKVLMVTLKNTCFRQSANDPAVSDEQMVALLVVADQYNLNPFTKEIYAYPDKNKGIVPVVSIDGWIRIINEHKDYNGYDVILPPAMEAPIEGERPACWAWVTIKLHRKNVEYTPDLTEYLDECYRPPIKKTGNNGAYEIRTPWQTHPKRLLRHKALIQAARAVFGFSGIYDDDEAARIAEAQSQSSVVSTIAAGGIAGARTNAAMEALKSKQGVLTNQAGTGGLDQAVDSGSPIREDAKPAAANKAELKTREAEWEDKKPAAAQQNRRDAFRYDAESAVAALRAQTSLEALKQTFEMISDDYAFSGREMPVDIDANFTFAKEEFEQGTRQ